MDADHETGVAMPLRRPICRGLLALVLCVDVVHSQENATQPMRRFGTTALRHGGRIQSLLFVPDGTLLVGGGNEPVRLWNLTTGKLEATFPDAWTQALALDPAHRRFVATGPLRALRFHGIGNVDAKLTVGSAPAGVRTAAFSPDGDHLLVGCQDGSLMHAQMDGSLNPTAKLELHKEEVNAVAWSDDGKIAVSGSADRHILVWKLEGKTLWPLRTINTPAPVRALVLGPGNALFEAGDDGVIRMRDLTTGDVLFRFEGHKHIVQSLAIHGTILVSSSMDGSIRIWNTAARTHVRTIARSFGDDDALALSVDGKLLAVGGDNGVIRLFDVDTGKERRLGDGPKAALVRSVRTPKFLAAIARDGAVHLWDPATGDATKSWRTETTPGVQQEFTLAVHPDGNVLVTGTSTVPALQLWSPDGGSLGAIPLGGESPVAAAFAASGKVLAVGCRSGAIVLVDWPERKVRQTTKASGPVTAIAFSLDSPVLAAATGTHVELFDVPTGQELRKIASKEGVPPAALPRIADLAFSPDGKTLGLACYDGVVRLVDWTAAKQLGEFEGHTSSVLGIAFAPDGRSFATAGFDKTVRIWETFLGKSIAVCSGHIGPATAVSFSSDGRTVFSASADTTLAAWDATGSRDGGTLAVKELSDDEFRRAWQDLTSEDPAVGPKALWRLCGAPSTTDRIGKTIYLVDPARVDRLFADLDSDDFSVREKATLQLKLNGRWMEGRYEVALRDPASLEAKRRIEWLVELLRGKEALTLRQERLRMHRALSVLEQLGDESARRVLDDLAKGAPEPDLQKEAELSLNRLRR
jgi:WD40 repeat protein